VFYARPYLYMSMVHPERQDPVTTFVVLPCDKEAPYHVSEKMSRRLVSSIMEPIIAATTTQDIPGLPFGPKASSLGWGI